MAITDFFKNKLKDQIETMLKNDGDSLPDVAETMDVGNQIGRKAIVDDPYFDNYSTNQYLYKQKMSRLSNKTLKDVSIRDWMVSAIIQARCDTLVRFARPSLKNLDMGYKIIKRGRNQDYSEAERKEIQALEEFIYNCGRLEGTPLDDRMLFGEFLKLLTRDALTFGHVAIEKVKTRAGGLHRLRPLPAESVYLINKGASKSQIDGQLQAAQNTYNKPKSDNDPLQEQQSNPADVDYYKYVQMSYDNRMLSAFGDEDMVFKLFNPQNFADAQGYCYSPLELAIVNITNHLNVENYNANFFTQGYAARGILHLKGTVTQSQMANFRRQFYNTISGTQHAWRTPIIAGLDDVQWVPMSGSAREMEYINFNNHLLRSICSQFQIDPVEIGMDYLVSATGRSSTQQANNEYKIEYSRERGLYPILMFFEDMINSDIIPSIDPELGKKYKFIFTGFSDATPQTEIAQMQAEMTVHSSMNDLLSQAEKDKLETVAAGLPLNQAFWMLVEKNFTRGEIREKFFGDKGAMLRRELQYIPADPAFLGWQQLLLTIDRARKQDEQMKQQMEAQQSAQEHSQTMDEKQHQLEKEQHESEQAAVKDRAAHDAVKAGSLKDIAKQFGASNQPDRVAGQIISNPINKFGENE